MKNIIKFLVALFMMCIAFSNVQAKTQGNVGNSQSNEVQNLISQKDSLGNVIKSLQKQVSIKDTTIENLQIEIESLNQKDSFDWTDWKVLLGYGLAIVFFIGFIVLTVLFLKVKRSKGGEEKGHDTISGLVEEANKKLKDKDNFRFAPKSAKGDKSSDEGSELLNDLEELKKMAENLKGRIESKKVNK